MFFSENLFNEYRTIEEIPKVIEDCARIHSECEHPASKPSNDEENENNNSVSETNELPKSRKRILLKRKSKDRK